MFFRGLRVRPSVHLFVCLVVTSETCEHDILKTSELLLMQIGTSGPRGKGAKWLISQVRGQKSRSHEAKIAHKNLFLGVEESTKGVGVGRSRLGVVVGEESTSSRAVEDLTESWGFWK